METDGYIDLETSNIFNLEWDDATEQTLMIFDEQLRQYEYRLKQMWSVFQFITEIVQGGKDELPENLKDELDLFERSILRSEKYVSDHARELDTKMEEVENEQR